VESGFAELCNEANAFKRIAWAESTKSTYRSQLKAYMRFCLYFDRNSCPADQDTLKCYVAFLSRSLNPNSIPGYLNIVRILHVNAGFVDPFKGNFEISMIKRGISRKLGRPPVQKLPITIEILLGIHSLLELMESGDRSFWAACLLAFYGMLRKNTFLPASVHDGSGSCVIRGDIIGLSKHCFLLKIRKSKTIQFGQRILTIPYVSCNNSILCPVSALLHHLGVSILPKTSPLFDYCVGARVSSWTHSTFVVRLKTCLTALAYNMANYSGHSFRRGGCSFCFEAGLDLTSIKQRGDWKSQAYERYLHVPKSVIFNGAVVLSEFAAKK
jgi:hypothetical protein